MGGVLMRSVSALFIMCVVAWLLIVGESYVFFAVIRPLGPPLHIGFRLSFLSSVLKILGTAGLIVGWIAAMLALRAFLFQFKLARKIPISSS
jgi:hypothetical protein